jgi:hypothetical protein
MKNEDHIEGIKQSITDIIGADTVLKRKKRTEDDVQKEKFEKMIRTLEQIEIRSMLLGNDLNIDLTDYDQKFYDIIDILLDMHFGKESCELIFFYLYERIAPDGSMNQLTDDNNNVVLLNSPEDLWTLIKMVQSTPVKKKK